MKQYISEKSRSAARAATSSLAENVTQAINDFDRIREAIQARGVTVPAGTSTAQYGGLIGQISGDSGEGGVIYSRNIVYDGIELFEDVALGESGITAKIAFATDDAYIPALTIVNNSGQLGHMILERSTAVGLIYMVEKAPTYQYRTVESGQSEYVSFVRDTDRYTKSTIKFFTDSYCYNIEFWIMPGDPEASSSEGPSRVVISEQNNVVPPIV